MMSKTQTEPDDDDTLTIDTTDCIETADVALAHGRNCLIADLPSQCQDEIDEARRQVELISGKRDTDVTEPMTELLGSATFYVEQNRFFRARKAMRDVQRLLHELRCRTD
jgi:hypothetical protein